MHVRVLLKIEQGIARVLLAKNERPKALRLLGPILGLLVHVSTRGAQKHEHYYADNEQQSGTHDQQPIGFGRVRRIGGQRRREVEKARVVRSTTIRVDGEAAQAFAHGVKQLFFGVVSLRRKEEPH